MSSHPRLIEIKLHPSVRLAMYRRRIRNGWPEDLAANEPAMARPVRHDHGRWRSSLVGGQPTFLNLDKPYPNHVFTAVIWGADRSSFGYAPETLSGKKVCVSGEITTYKGVAEIIVSSPKEILQQ